jgi:hypothetical protein
MNSFGLSGQPGIMSTHPAPSEPPDPRHVHPTAPGGHEPGERAITGHGHLYGRPSSWVLVTVVIAAFVAGGFAIIYHAWWLLWVCVGVVVLSVPAGKFTGIMGDTVMVGNPAMQPGQEGHVAKDTGSAADPGVDLGVPGAAAQAGVPASPERTGHAE